VKIIGRGLVARTLVPVSEQFGTAVVFATGTADSGCTDRAVCDREMELMENALGQCRREDHRFVYFSSAGKIYGEAPGKSDESTPCNPTSAYGQHKLDCETLIRSLDCRHLIVRIPNLVGPMQNPRQLVPALVLQVLRGAVTAYSGATRDLVGVDRFREILLELLGNVSDQETVVLASGISFSSEAIIDRIQHVLGTNARVSVVDGGRPEEYAIDKLRRLAPRTSWVPQNYLDDVIDCYVPSLAKHLTTDDRRPQEAQ